jgi:inorganic pyrophosphatase
MLAKRALYALIIRSHGPAACGPRLHFLILGINMDISKISTGKAPPWDIHVVIEVPMRGAPVKYEMDKESGALYVDRFLHTPMIYPANYGFIPGTLSGDGDPVDVLVISDIPVFPGAVIRARPIGVLFMEDESGVDEKLLAVPVEKLDPTFKEIKNYTDLPELTRERIKHFFEHYKDLEKGKWVKIKEWGDAAAAAKAVLDGIALAKAP